MTIPDVPDLGELMLGIRLCPNKPPAQNAAVQIPFFPARDEAGRISQEPPLWLYYPADTRVTLKRLVERINKELSVVQHARRDEFALFVLAIAALSPPNYGNVISRVNGIIAQVCDADVSLYYILFAGFPEEHNFELPPFRLGPLRTEKLMYSCEKAESDYYSRYREMMQKAWAVQREPLKVRVFDIPPIRATIFDGPLGTATRQAWEFRAWESIVNNYFSLQNRVLPGAGAYFRAEFGRTCRR
jgi:hypothetical protein